VPGCGNRRFLHVHHIDPLSGGGQDHARNLSTVCSTCHRSLHRGLLELQGEAPTALTWRDRRGALLKDSHPGHAIYSE
jgi:predicted HNH restriction endonuclease